MESNNNIELNLKNLIYRILKHWRIIFILMLIGAFLSNGYYYFKTKKTASTIQAELDEYNSQKSNPETVKEDLSKYEQILDPRQIEEVNSVFDIYMTYQASFISSTDYVNNSLLMDIDYKCIPTYNLVYLIDTHYVVQYPEINKTNFTADISNSINDTLLNDDFLIDVSSIVSDDNSSINPAYISELFSTTVVGDTFSISIYGRNKDECESIKNVVKDEMKEVFDELEKKYGDFDYSLLSETYTESIDSNILYTQKNTADVLTSIYNNTRNILTSLTNDQKAYFYALVSNENAEIIALPIETGTDVSISSPSALVIPEVKIFNCKYLLLGAFSTFLLVCIWIVLTTIFSGRMLTNDDIEKMFGLSQIGIYRISKESRGFLHLFDDCIIKFFDDKGTQFSAEENLDMIVAGIRISAKKNKWKNIYLTSTANDNGTQNSITELSEKLNNVVDSVSYGKSIVYDSDSLENLCNSDAVVFIEKIDTSKINEIISEYKICKKYDIPIIGYVTIKKS